MMTSVDPYVTASACWRRRQHLCIGYRVRYIRETDTREVSVFAVENGRTHTPLGTLRLQAKEWETLFPLIYKKWEDLDYPVPDDKEDIGLED